MCNKCLFGCLEPYLSVVVLFRRQSLTGGCSNSPDWMDLCQVHGFSGSMRRIGGMGGLEMVTNILSSLLTRKVLLLGAGRAEGRVRRFLCFSEEVPLCGGTKRGKWQEWRSVGGY